MSELSQILDEYTGPEVDRVREAIAALAGDDVRRAKHFVETAIKDYRDVLWWAEQRREYAHRLSGMTVNERIHHLGLMSAWDKALDDRDPHAAGQILRRCLLSPSDIEAI